MFLLLVFLASCSYLSLHWKYKNKRLISRTFKWFLLPMLILQIIHLLPYNRISLYCSFSMMCIHEKKLFSPFLSFFLPVLVPWLLGKNFFSLYFLFFSSHWGRFGCFCSQSVKLLSLKLPPSGKSWLVPTPRRVFLSFSLFMFSAAAPGWRAKRGRAQREGALVVYNYSDSGRGKWWNWIEEEEISIFWPFFHLLLFLSPSAQNSKNFPVAKLVSLSVQMHTFCHYGTKKRNAL